MYCSRIYDQVLSSCLKHSTSITHILAYEYFLRLRIAFGNRYRNTASRVLLKGNRMINKLNHIVKPFGSIYHEGNKNPKRLVAPCQ